MSHVVPSQIVEATNTLFGGQQNELDSGTIAHWLQSEVRTLLGLLDQVPRDLIALPFPDYLEFEQCRSVLATALPAWNLGGTQPAKAVKGKNAIVRIRRLMMQCQDELTPPEPEFPFVTDLDTRLGIEDRIRAAWIDFNVREWLGATTSAAVALEAVLLWEIKRIEASSRPGAGKAKGRKAANDMGLDDLIRTAAEEGSISPESAKQAHLARDARNLIHPGKVARSGTSCDKSTALVAFAAVYSVANELNRAFAKRSAR
jgi:hypothetical protein